MGFRSYVRHFWGAIAKLFRPSLPWGFAAGSGSLLGFAASHQQQQQQQQQERLQQQEKSNLNHHFQWVSEVALGIFAVQFRNLSVLHCHGDLPLGVVRF